MKFKVWSEIKEEKTTYLQLIGEYGEVRVVLVDEDGERLKNLVGIGSHGINRYGGVGEGFGFPVDDSDRIVDDT